MFLLPLSSLHRPQHADRVDRRARALGDHRIRRPGRLRGQVRRIALARARATSRGASPRPRILMNTRGLMELVVLNIGLDSASRSLPRPLRDDGDHGDRGRRLLTTPLLACVYPQRDLASARASGTRARAFSGSIPTARRSRRRGAPPPRAADRGRTRRGARVGRAACRSAGLSTRPDRAALASAGEHGASDTAAPLAALLAEARANGIALEPLAVVGQEVADAVNAAPGSRKCDLVLLRYGQPLIGSNVSGRHGPPRARATRLPTSRVLRRQRLGRAAPNPGSLPRRPPRQARARARAADRCRHTNVEITVLHVVARGHRDPGAQRLGAKTIVESMFDEASGSVALRVVEDDRPVEAVLSAAYPPRPIWS